MQARGDGWHGRADGSTLTADGRPFDPRADAINVLDGRIYPHHPVMRRVPLRVYPLEAKYLTEWNGLRVPAAYDCDMFNHHRKEPHWGNHWYFFEVPTRWAACEQHRAALASGLLTVAPQLPMVDDEYTEQVAVFHTVLRAVHATRARPGRSFVFAELGARWGTWGARAAALARQLAPAMRLKVRMVEGFRKSCSGATAVLKKNRLDDVATVRCAYETPTSLGRWLAEQPHVDAIDMDIQGGEGAILSNESLLALLESRVARLIVGTHSPRIHSDANAALRARGWRVLWEVQPNKSPHCLHIYLRGAYNASHPQRFDYTKVLADAGCHHASPRGPVAHADGEIIADNPRLVRPGFSLAANSEAELIVDDLIQPSLDRLG